MRPYSLKSLAFRGQRGGAEGHGSFRPLEKPAGRAAFAKKLV